MLWASCFVALLIGMLIRLAWLPKNMFFRHRLVKKTRDLNVAVALRVSVSTLTSARLTSLPFLVRRDGKRGCPHLCGVKGEGEAFKTQSPLNSCGRVDGNSPPYSGGGLEKLSLLLRMKAEGVFQPLFSFASPGQLQL